MKASKEYNDHGNKFTITCAFDSLVKAPHTQLEYKGTTYLLSTNDGFIEWIYLVLPTSFSGDIDKSLRTRFPNYVNQITIQPYTIQPYRECVDLKLNVNSLNAGASGGGFTVQPKVYNLSFIN
jgi:hypothetical protein